MTARDHYFIPATSEHFDTYESMCDEIDQLRMPVELYDTRLAAANQMIHALHEMVEELTKHADAMREALNAQLTAPETWGLNMSARHIMDAYDEYIREA